MANSNRPFRPHVRYGLNATPGMEAPEAASQTYEKGAILVASGGRVQEGAADPTAIVGVADRDGQNNATAGAVKTQYTPALSPMIGFEATLNIAAGGHKIVAADLLVEYGITKDADGIWFVDQAKTGVTGRVRVVQFVDPIGTANGRVIVIFSGDATIYDQS